MPAYPYYYSYNNKVYKVGAPFSRSFGLLYIYKLRISPFIRQLLGNEDQITEVALGPMDWAGIFGNTQPGLFPACVFPVMDRGIIKQITDKVKIPQPQKYEYYLGYNSTNKQKSNDDYFVEYSFKEKKFYPITGLRHALNRLLSGYIKGINTQNSDEVIKTDFWGALKDFGKDLLPFVGGIINEELRDSGVSFDEEQLFNFFYGPLQETLIRIFRSSVNFAKDVMLPVYIFYVIAKFLYFVYTQIIPTDYTVEEPCRQLVRFKTTGPYIETGQTLIQNYSYFDWLPTFTGGSPILITDKTRTMNGYYCDGAYFYQQSGNVVTTKELSSTTGLVKYDKNYNPILGFDNSITPDSPTFIQNGTSLMFLPYTSGVPINDPLDFSGFDFYFNFPISGSIPPDVGGEMEDTQLNVDLYIPQGTTISFNSQGEADDIAQDLFDGMVSSITGTTDTDYNYSSPISVDDIGIVTSYFTHEIKIENEPKNLTLFYNNTDNQDLTIGKNVFYDMTGRYKVLNGFYSTTGDTSYRLFYKLMTDN
jgi:hypothetical protein